MSLAAFENRNKDKEIMKEIHFSLKCTRTLDYSGGQDRTKFCWLKHSL